MFYLKLYSAINHKPLGLKKTLPLLNLIIIITAATTTTRTTTKVAFQQQQQRHSNLIVLHYHIFNMKFHIIKSCILIQYILYSLICTSYMLQVRLVMAMLVTMVYVPHITCAWPHLWRTPNSVLLYCTIYVYTILYIHPKFALK